MLDGLPTPFCIEPIFTDTPLEVSLDEGFGFSCLAMFTLCFPLSDSCFKFQGFSEEKRIIEIVFHQSLDTESLSLEV